MSGLSRRGLLRFTPLAALTPLVARIAPVAQQAALRVQMWRPPPWDPVCTLLDQDGSQITQSRIVGVFSDARPLEEGRDFVYNASGWGLQLLPHVDFGSIFIHYRA